MSIHVVYTKIGPFEWDPDKSESNFQKHGYEFDICKQLFLEDLVDTVDDKRHYGEERRIATGAVATTVLVAVYTWRNQRRRIISVRRANRNERKTYFKRKTQKA